MKRLRNNKKINIFLIIIGFFLIIVGFILILFDLHLNHKKNIEEEKYIESFFDDKQVLDNNNVQEVNNDNNKSHSEINNNYIAILEIPIINLKKGLFDIHDVNNDVNKNIEILEPSSMPNIEKGNLILAGHSGIGRIAYFKNLYKLNVGDIANIYYNRTKYIYQISKIYYIKKDGTAYIDKNKDKTVLTMITCHSNSDKQIVIISELIDRTNY